MVACTVASVVLGIRLFNYLSVVGVHSIDFTSMELQLVPSEIGGGVAAAWTIQAIGGRWRPEPTWIDRAGRLLGAFWIVTTPFPWFTFGT